MSTQQDARVTCLLLPLDVLLATFLATCSYGRSGPHIPLLRPNWRQVKPMEDRQGKCRRALLGRNSTCLLIAAVISAIVCLQSTGQWSTEGEKDRGAFLTDEGKRQKTQRVQSSDGRRMCSCVQQTVQEGFSFPW